MEGYLIMRYSEYWITEYQILQYWTTKNWISANHAYYQIRHPVMRSLVGAPPPGYPDYKNNYIVYEGLGVLPSSGQYSSRIHYIIILIQTNLPYKRTILR
jgi:hypothetical protein